MKESRVDTSFNVLYKGLQALADVWRVSVDYQFSAVRSH